MPTRLPGAPPKIVLKADPFSPNPPRRPRRPAEDQAALAPNAGTSPRSLSPQTCQVRVVGGDLAPVAADHFAFVSTG